jgi:hypothetical protein
MHASKPIVRSAAQTAQIPLQGSHPNRHVVPDRTMIGTKAEIIYAQPNIGAGSIPRR